MLKIVDRIDLALAKELGDRRREKHGVTHHEWEVLEMKMWKQFCEAKDNGGVTKTYNINQFVSLPWNWQALQQAKIVNALYYYAKESYVNGQPEPLQDNEFSLITLPNLNSIPRDELSPKNLISGNIPNQQQFLQFLKNPQAWYDDKIDQVYDGISMIGKRPEDFGGTDIRSNLSLAKNC